MTARLASGLVLVLTVSALVFLIFEVLPAEDPAVARAGEGATEQQVKAIRTSFGLDRPLPERFGDFLSDLARGELGTSYRYGVPVTDLIRERLPVTALLIGGALVVWLLAGVLAGVLGAARPGSVLDRGVGGISLLLISIPIFVLGYLALLLFASDADSVFSLFPGIGAYAEADGFPARVAAMILPWAVLGLSSAAIYFRLTRATIRDELDREYVLAARARGIPEGRVLWRHAARTGSAPLLALLGLDVALIAAGNVILVEAVFNLPGIGGLLVTSIESSDLPVIEGVVLCSAVLVILVNIAVDLGQAAIDPRVRPPRRAPSTCSRDRARPARDPSTSS